MKRIVVKLIKNRGFLTEFYVLALYMQHLPSVAIHRYAYY